MRHKNRKLEYIRRCSFYESSLASMYAKLISLEKGLARLTRISLTENRQDAADLLEIVREHCPKDKAMAPKGKEGQAVCSRSLNACEAFGPIHNN